MFLFSFSKPDPHSTEKTHTYTFNQDTDGVAIYKSDKSENKLTFVNQHTIKVESFDLNGNLTGIFHLIRRGVENASAKGQLKLTAEDFSDIEVKIKSQNQEDSSISVTLDEEGSFETGEIETGDYDIEIQKGEDEPLVVKDVRIEKPEDDAGIITVNETSHNFKTILEPASDFSFEGSTYKATIKVHNMGTEIATGVNYQIISDSPHLIIENQKGILDSILGGTTKTLSFTYSIQGLTAQSEVQKFSIILKDTSGNEWKDHAYIEAWRRKVKVNFSAVKGAGVSGLAIFENRRLYHFQVSGNQTVILPEIRGETYKFAMSATDISQETVYSIGVHSETSNMADFTDTSAFEPNESESAATKIELYEPIISYIHVGDVDFYEFTLADEDSFPKGTGTEEDPLIVMNSSHFIYLDKHYDTLNGLYIKMGQDIDLSDFTTGIQSDLENFHFDGGGFALSNFKVKPEGSKYAFGLFRSIFEGSRIENVVIKGFEIDRGSYDLERVNPCTGALLGSARGPDTIIKNVSIMNSSIKDKSGNYVGAVAGCLGIVALENIRLNGIQVQGEGVAGAVAGTTQDNVDIPSKKVYAVNSTVSSNDSVGGLFGAMAGTSISECYADIEITGTSYAGGIVGRQSRSGGYDILSDCAAAGTVNGVAAGGLVGYSRNLTVKNSFATAKVTGTGSGGLVAELEPITLNSFLFYENSFWDAATTGLNSSVATAQTGSTTTQMQDQATYTGWDFTNIWLPPQPGSYPSLRWMAP